MKTWRRRRRDMDFWGKEEILWRDWGRESKSIRKDEVKERKERKKDRIGRESA